MSNKLSFWDGQPVTAPVYPQMGDIQHINPNLSGCGSRLWQGVAATFSAAVHQQYQPATAFYGGAGPGTTTPQRPMPMMVPMQGQGMGDFQHMACSQMPTSNFFGHHNGQYESCIGNVEAFCAYNGIDTSTQGGGPMVGHGGARGDFW